MGHQLDALLVQAPLNPEIFARFHLPVLPLPQGFVLVPLNLSWLEHLENQYPETAFVPLRPVAFRSHPLSSVLCDSVFIHALMAEQAPHSPYCLLKTDYFGGVGFQLARVYAQGALLADGLSLQEALGSLGVRSEAGTDAFESLGLEKFRNSFAYFEGCLASLPVEP
ncbi:hypothetical protein COW36_14080 [bacterium (Candidatus Blackallbacteria) CG17_big_fil_post_rev_8_21_14_2_50_48_46]|uniref:Uncharacterized protein n=1 Tax=bacterium (Candidatus Blackallbacteria) CG17_big_fil_post_rev_8_21_14_2_50_48_46 TaxID=2014261 RepID=A0A2M7G358_9BACT|nr:MAG: hypothetical protein COW64_23550 [bacterium (Candidatus Blackallbacteria) CG18_big_fil_WC_8_21_14_2_50_49_26]PIW16249.1 MAG: hypothetical protein COW36_14080 [bacterium (Candidatus Blackallbacteria) CG17_big_fil_post_rev_8_21_14_2_50_48_46]PIW49870.1 MAG: hypothetical protein COW20_04225 [bacterium (Candidatus Blackallbacteria) CG13_big_fil_rev_8_21_14_2_50_49_14]